MSTKTELKLKKSSTYFLKILEENSIILEKKENGVLIPFKTELVKIQWVNLLISGKGVIQNQKIPGRLLDEFFVDTNTGYSIRKNQLKKVFDKLEAMKLRPIRYGLQPSVNNGKKAMIKGPHYSDYSILKTINKRNKLLAIPVLGILAISLLANQVLSVKINNQQLKEKSVLRSKHELIKIQKEKEENEEIVRKVGHLNPPIASLLIDRIVSTKPKNLELYQINYKWAEEKINAEFKPRINLLGYSKSTTFLNEFLEVLNKNEWIEHAHIDEFKAQRGSENNQFTIQVLCKKKF